MLVKKIGNKLASHKADDIFQNSIKSLMLDLTVIDHTKNLVSDALKIPKYMDDPI